MAINIKNPEAVDLVQRLSRQLGVGVTEAVMIAAKAMLRDEGAETRRKRVLAILDRMDAIMPDEVRAIDIDSEFYDEDGLPK